jgi:hypothetical protein
MNDSDRQVASRNDLNFEIIFTNLSTGLLKSYAGLAFDDNRSSFGNYYWLLYQKIGGEYRQVQLPISSSPANSAYIDLLSELKDPSKVDSAFAVYDLPKKDLLPSLSDTLTFNFLDDKRYLEPGEYGLVVYLRAGNFYVIHRDIRETSGINYVRSDMYHFKVLKPLKSVIK